MGRARAGSRRFLVVTWPRANGDEHDAVVQELPEPDATGDDTMAEEFVHYLNHVVGPGRRGAATWQVVWADSPWSATSSG